jgi:ribonuclease HI
MADPVVLQIHTDGASRGNPGAAAYAYVIAGPDGDPIEEADCLGTMTNNQAEYIALIRALEHALELGADNSLVIHSDSELMVKQMNGEYRVKNEDLRDLYEKAQALTRRFRGPVRFRHVRRAENSRADALCNEALDGKRLAMPRRPFVNKVETASTKRPTLGEQARACLREAGVAEPEAVWERLVDVLKRNGVRLP